MGGAKVLDQSSRSQPTLALSLPQQSTLSGTGGGVGAGAGAGAGASDSLNSPAATTPSGHNHGQSVGSMNLPTGYQRTVQTPSLHDRSISYGSIQSRSSPSSQQQFAPRNSYQQASSNQQAPSAQQTAHTRFNGSVGSSSSSVVVQGAPQLGALPFQTSQPQLPQGPLTSHSPPSPGASAGKLSKPAPSQGLSNGPSPPSTAPASARSVFGLSLSRLYERDALAVPMVVYQCIQAVDLYGLSNEGIYRLSGSVPAVNKLKHMFDTDSASTDLDFRNPENFFHDVNSVAGLLKQFFRDLPDPLLPRHQYGAFVEAASKSSIFSLVPA